MAFSESELKVIDATVGDLCRRCSPAHVTDQLRTVCAVEAHSVDDTSDLRELTAIVDQYVHCAFFG